ncbi:hypothetical protein RN10_2594 [Mycobacterium tuberculosis]|nr:hypothetical protein RN10_2594 [Mycobacterium tuberculosis]
MTAAPEMVRLGWVAWQGVWLPVGAGRRVGGQWPAGAAAGAGDAGGPLATMGAMGVMALALSVVGGAIGAGLGSARAVEDVGIRPWWRSRLSVW